MIDDPREYGESLAWDGTPLRTCGWCSFAQDDDPNDPDNHAKWCNDEAWRESRKRAATDRAAQAEATAAALAEQLARERDEVARLRTQAERRWWRWW